MALTTFITRYLHLIQDKPVTPDGKPVPTGDLVEGITNTTETATEAAKELASWVTSGSREALIMLGIVIGSMIGLLILRRLLLKAVTYLPKQDSSSLSALAQRVLARFRPYFMLAISFFLAEQFVTLPQAVESGVRIFLVIATVLQIAEWVQEVAISSVKRSAIRRVNDANTLASAINIIKWFLNVLIWSLAALLLLSNVGVNVTALLAGLGIGGVAIGFAAQGIFRDLFSSLSIIMDKPFQVGDTIRYGQTWGTIEDIGLKTTRLREKHGEQVIISNTNLLDLEIHNMTRMSRRRIQTGFGVIYQTSPEVAEAIPGLVAAMFKDLKNVQFDRCGMSAFGNSSLDYELVFFSNNPDFNRAMAAKSAVLLALFRLFKDEGIVFAYPTQTIFIEEADLEEADMPATPDAVSLS